MLLRVTRGFFSDTSMAQTKQRMSQVPDAEGRFGEGRYGGRYVPETLMPALDLLIKMQATRTHMALVIDEYGGTDGLVSIEDIVEVIVGDIEDEYDFDESAGNIVLDNAGRYRVKATTEIGDFNAAFGTAIPDEEFDTVGGLVLNQLGRMPKRNEMVVFEGWRFQVLRADSRRVHTLLVDQQRNLPLEGGE